MSSPRPWRSLERALAGIRAHFREYGRSPSLSELGRRIGCSPQRARDLVQELERRGEITRTPGLAFSICLTSPGPGSMLSDEEVLHEARTRGLVDWEVARGLCEGLSAAAGGVAPLSTMALPERLEIEQLLNNLGGECGIGEAEEEGGAPEGRARQGDLAAQAGGAGPGDPPARHPRRGGDGGASRRAA